MNRWTAFLGVVFLLPLFQGSVQPIAWTVAASVLFIIMALEFRARSRDQTNKALPKLPLPQPFTNSRLPLTVIWGIQLWAVTQCFLFSLSPYDSLVSLSQGLLYSAMFTLALLLMGSRERVRQFIWVVVSAAAFQALYGAFMVLSGVEYGFFAEKEHYRGVATGTYVNRNSLAGLLELALALGIGLLLGEPTRYFGNARQRLRQFIEVLLSKKVVLRLLLAILVIALVLTRSRMGNTAFFASLMASGALALLLMRNKTTATTVLLGSLLVIDIAIVGTFFGVDKVAERLQQTSAQTESRDEVTRDAINIILEQPVIGIGAGTFTHTFPALKSEEVTTFGLYNNAHNDYVQFAYEFGIPATLALASIVLWAFWNAVIAMRERNSRFYQGVGFSVTMAIVAIGIHSTVDFNLQIPANAALFVAILALSAIARWAPHNSGR